MPRCRRPTRRLPFAVLLPLLISSTGVTRFGKRNCLPIDNGRDRSLVSYLVVRTLCATRANVLVDLTRYVCTNVTVLAERTLVQRNLRRNRTHATRCRIAGIRTNIPGRRCRRSARCCYRIRCARGFTSTCARIASWCIASCHCNSLLPWCQDPLIILNLKHEECYIA